ncbi:MAG: chromosome partitioning protein ParB, partial [Cyanobacteria bacterium P01_E01_bin.6]
RIEYTKAQAIARLNDQKQRKNLLKEAIDNQLSISQIKQKTQSVKHEQNQESNDSLKNRWMQINAHLKSENLWQRLKDMEEFEQILLEIEKLLIHLRG